MNLNVNVLANFCVFSRITTSCYLCRKIVIDHFQQYYDVVNIIRERWLETYLTIQAKVVNKELLRLGTIPATVVKQVRSQKTQNEWTVLHLISKRTQRLPSIIYYTTLQNEDGIYVYNPIITEDSVYVVVLQPHVFRRYRERLALDEKMKTAQLIRRYMKQNTDGQFMPAGQHKDEPSNALCIKEGVVLGNFVGEQVYLGRTFITYDMAHEGSQADTFYEGDEKRSKLKMQAASARDVIRRSRETERITHETEQEQKEQE